MRTPPAKAALWCLANAGYVVTVTSEQPFTVEAVSPEGEKFTVAHENPETAAAKLLAWAGLEDLD